MQVEEWNEKKEKKEKGDERQLNEGWFVRITFLSLDLFGHSAHNWLPDQTLNKRIDRLAKERVMGFSLLKDTLDQRRGISRYIARGYKSSILLHWSPRQWILKQWIKLHVRPPPVSFLSPGRGWASRRIRCKFCFSFPQSWWKSPSMPK
jgi:hypothetical protein